MRDTPREFKTREARKDTRAPHAHTRIYIYTHTHVDRESMDYSGDDEEYNEMDLHSRDNIDVDVSLADEERTKREGYHSAPETLPSEGKSRRKKIRKKRSQNRTSIDHLRAISNTISSSDEDEWIDDRYGDGGSGESSPVKMQRKKIAGAVRNAARAVKSASSRVRSNIHETAIRMKSTTQNSANVVKGKISKTWNNIITQGKPRSLTGKEDRDTRRLVGSKNEAVSSRYAPTSDRNKKDKDNSSVTESRQPAAQDKVDAASAKVVSTRSSEVGKRHVYLWTLIRLTLAVSCLLCGNVSYAYYTNGDEEQNGWMREVVPMIPAVLVASGITMMALIGLDVLDAFLSAPSPIANPASDGTRRE